MISGTVLLSARDKAASVRRENSEKINQKKLLRRRRVRDEVSPRGVAIANHCRECMGFDGDEYSSLAAKVKDCPCVKCHCWPWRTGKFNTGGEGELW